MLSQLMRLRKGKSLGAILLGLIVLALNFYLENQPSSENHIGSKFSKRRSSEAGVYDYLTLVLSWSPSYCLTAGQGKAGLQCGREKSYAFVLHGLWPQNKKGWSESCPGNTSVPKAVVNSMLDIMPAPGLIKHEYRKHGTCTGLDPKQYYQLSRELFESIDIPEKYQNLQGFLRTSAKEIQTEFLKANPELRPEMIAINCSGGNENRLKDLRICYNSAGQLRNCGKNEKTSRLCHGKPVNMPPLRANSGSLF